MLPDDAGFLKCSMKYCLKLDFLKIFFGGELNTTEHNDPDQMLSWVLNSQAKGGGLLLVKMRLGCYSYGVFLELSCLVKNGGNRCLPTFFFPQIFLLRPYILSPDITVLKKWNDSAIIIVVCQKLLYQERLKSIFLEKNLLLSTAGKTALFENFFQNTDFRL